MESFIIDDKRQSRFKTVSKGKGSSKLSQILLHMIAISVGQVDMWGDFWVMGVLG